MDSDLECGRFIYSLLQEDTDQHSEIVQKYAGSSQWILKDDKIQSWMEGTRGTEILWLNGIPGGGKTILASVIIDKCVQDRSTATAYFYCTEHNQEKNNSTSVLRSLLRQLLNLHPRLIQNCSAIYLPQRDCLKLLLKYVCKEIPKIRIIIDGLDECKGTGRGELLSFLIKTARECNDSDPGKLQVLFVSQDYLDIATTLRDVPTLKLTANRNESDIKSYVHTLCQRIQNRHSLSNDQVEDIEISISTRACGMFIYVKSVTNTLYQLPSRQEVIQESKDYLCPSDLKQYYERIVQRLIRDMMPEESPCRWTTACKILGLVASAKRPLKWREIQAALSINHQCVQFEECMLTIGVQDYCRPLVQVSNGAMEFVHATAEMYILDSLHINALIAECELTTLCLRYLTFDCFRGKVDTESFQRSARKGSLSFQDYAAFKWPDHIKTIVTMAAHSPPIAERAAFRGLRQALTEFYDCYEDEFLESDENCIVPDDLKGLIKESSWLFGNSAYYCELLLNHIHCHTAGNNISLKAIEVNVLRNRELLEKLSSGVIIMSEKEAAYFREFYGDKAFKCSNIACFYFHEGFVNSMDRAEHSCQKDQMPATSLHRSATSQTHLVIREKPGKYERKEASGEN